MKIKMRTSERGKQLIKEFEGKSLKAYKDSAGLWTIGYGHLIKDNEKHLIGRVITDKEASDLLTEDLKDTENAVNELVKVQLNQNQFDAIVSFVFNIGKTKFKNSSVLTHLNNKDFDKAMKSLLLYRNVTIGGKKVPVRGLVRRREAEKELFLTPVKNIEQPTEQVKQEVKEEIKDEVVLSEQKEIQNENVIEKDKINIEKVTTHISNALDNIYNVETRVSRSSLFSALATKLIGFLLLIFGVIQDNYREILIASFLIGIGLLFLHFSKKRATERFLAIFKND
jgi:lysozyme